MMSSKKEMNQNQSFYMAEPKNEEYINRLVNGILDQRLKEKSYIDVLPGQGKSIPDYIAEKSGSVFYGYNDAGKKVKNNSDFTDLINSLITEGGDNTHIFIKSPKTGNLECNGIISIPSGTTGITIEGGPYNWYTGGCVLKASDDACTFIIKDDNTSQAFNYFKNLSFDGDCSGARSSVTGLKTRGTDSHIERCSAYDCAVGINVRYNAIIKECWIEECATGLECQGRKSKILNNVFYSNSLHDIYMTNNMDDHLIMGNTTGGSKHFIKFEHGTTGNENIQIINNQIKDCTDDAIILVTTAVDKIIVAHNVVDGGGVTPYLVFRTLATYTVTNGMLHGNLCKNLATGLINDATGWTQSDNINV